MSPLDKFTNYLENRLQAPTVWRSFTDRNIPRGVGWAHTFGSATLFLLLVQMATGIFLAFYYAPSPEHAYHSVDVITTQLQFGWLVRGIHKWAASLTVVLVVLHLLRVLYMGAYKYPRELTWVVGVLLLLVILAFGFTGYLLPWDQKAYWATVVGTHIASYTPVAGPYVMELLRGQPEVGVRTLSRFYAMHTLFLPALLWVLVAVHLAMVIKQGIAPPPVKEFASIKREDYATVYGRLKESGKPFYEAMSKDAIIAVVLLSVVFLMAWKFGTPLEAEADPTSTTYVPRPEWYFFFLFELLWWFPGEWIPVATFWIPLALVLLLLALPWLDRSMHRAPLRRPLTTSLTTAVLAIAAFLTYKGATAPLPPTAAAAQTKVEAREFPPEVQLGIEVYEQQACAACHEVNGVGGTAGPSLTGIGAKREAQWLKRFIVDPAGVLPDASMPPSDLTPEQLDALVAYLQAPR